MFFNLQFSDSSYGYTPLMLEVWLSNVADTPACLMTMIISSMISMDCVGLTDVYAIGEIKQMPY